MKAMLMIDMPTECVECPLCSDGQCDALGIYLEDGFNQRYERCPLRPLPERKEVDKYVALDLINASTVYTDLISFNVGWNACLREITGETEWEM